MGTSGIAGIASLSSVAPALPGGYSYSRRIGSIKTDSSGNILAFKQNGNYFYWNSPVLDVQTTSSTTRTLYTLSIPSGLITIPLISAVANSTGTSYGLFTCPNQADVTPTSCMCDTANSSSASYSVFSAQVLSNASSQIGFKATYGGGLYITTDGSIDTRGRN